MEELGECIAHQSKFRTQTPGPGAYKIKRKFKGAVPVIRMKSRHTATVEPPTSPYYMIKTGNEIGNVPKIHFGGRNDMSDKFKTPGCTYVPPAFGSNSRTHGFGRPKSQLQTIKKSDGSEKTIRPRNPDETPGPGPGTYNCQIHEFDGTGKRGNTISGHHDFKYDISLSPGPSAYRPHYEAILPKAPVYGFHDRPKTKEPEITPGYRNIGSTLGGPKYSMKRRADDDINII